MSQYGVCTVLSNIGKYSNPNKFLIDTYTVHILHAAMFCTCISYAFQWRYAPEFSCMFSLVLVFPESSSDEPKRVEANNMKQ